MICRRYLDLKWLRSVGRMLKLGECDVKAEKCRQDVGEIWEYDVTCGLGGSMRVMTGSNRSQRVKNRLTGHILRASR